MPELDAKRIAAVALAIANARGVQGFSMRAVAEELGVTPMALYHHVKDKAALAALVIDSAIQSRPLPAPTGKWQDDLLAIAQWSRTSMIVHPVIGHLRREFSVWTPSMLSVTERWMDLWRASGLTPTKAKLAAITSSMAITGFIHEEMLLSNLRMPGADALSSLPNAQAMFTTKLDSQMNFVLMVQSLITGLHARLGAREHRTTRKATTTKKTTRRRLRPT